MTWLRVIFPVAGWLAVGAQVVTGVPSFDAVHVFGDNASAVSGGPYFQGRWCNGLVWSEDVASKWGLTSQSRNNHAQGLATSQIVLNQARALTGINLDKALCLYFAGMVDFGSNFAPDPIASNWSTLSRQVMANCSNGVTTLYAKGARTVVFVNQPDLMRFPQFSTLVERDRAFYRQSTIEFNRAMRTTAVQIAALRTNLTLVIVDLFALLEAVLDRPEVYGFTETAISVIHDTRLANKAYDGPGRNYLFWDASSVTARMHSMMADWVEASLLGTSLSLAPSDTGWELSAQRLLIGKAYAVQRSTDGRVWDDYAAGQALFFNGDLSMPPALEPSVEFFRLRYTD
jgi:phospholipase/lecithinase/hemolysin